MGMVLDGPKSSFFTILLGILSSGLLRILFGFLYYFNAKPSAIRRF